MKIANISRRKSLYLLNDLRNFNDVAYDNIKSKKKQDFTLSLENTYLEKPQEGVKLTPLQAFLGLSTCGDRQYAC